MTGETLRKYCVDCGETVSTGSQLWIKCPENGRWKAVSARCDL